MDRLSSLVLNKANIGIILVDKLYNIVCINNWFERYAGIKEKDVKGQPITRLMPILSKQYYQQIIKNVFEKGQSMFCSGALHSSFIEINNKNINHANDKKVRQNMLLDPIRYNDETYLLIQITDTTSQHKQVQLLKNEINERKRIETALRASEEEMKTLRDKALTASKAKTEFLAVMSHEIRTPMNAIIGMADLLAETELDSEQNEYIEILRYSSLNLLQIINDILDVSKIESGKFEINKMEFDIQYILEELVDFYRFQSKQKGIELVYYEQYNTPINVIGDPIHIKQIFSNLLSNAIKFTEQGTITLSITCNPIETNRMKLDFEIKDTGIGVAKDKIADIFEPFTQADSSTTRKFGGTGLGLAIVKRLLDSMEGSIYLESSDEQGAVFKGFLLLDIANQ